MWPQQSYRSGWPGTLGFYVLDRETGVSESHAGQAESGVALDPPAISSQVASLSKGSQWQGGRA